MADPGVAKSPLIYEFKATSQWDWMLCGKGINQPLMLMFEDLHWIDFERPVQPGGGQLSNFLGILEGSLLRRPAFSLRAPFDLDSLKRFLVPYRQ
jgi:hypothetical protein